MRSASSALLALILGLFTEPAGAEPANVRLLVQSSPLAGARYYAAADVWQQLRVGARLELAREMDNLHDPYAVSVSWRGRKLGYVPRRENRTLAWALERGEPLQARISRLASPRRVELEVYLE